MHYKYGCYFVRHVQMHTHECSLNTTWHHSCSHAPHPPLHITHILQPSPLLSLPSPLPPPYSAFPPPPSPSLTFSRHLSCLSIAHSLPLITTASSSPVRPFSLCSTKLQSVITTHTHTHHTVDTHTTPHTHINTHNTHPYTTHTHTRKYTKHTTHKPHIMEMTMWNTIGWLMHLIREHLKLITWMTRIIERMVVTCTCMSCIAMWNVQCNHCCHTFATLICLIRNWILFYLLLLH